jgi:pilus assembly protein CpaB
MRPRLKIPVLARPGKTAVVLGVALVSGVIAALAANRFLAGRIEAIEARNRGATVEVVVARRHLGKGHVLGPDSAALRAVPKNYAHSNALTQENFAKAVGRVLAYDVQPGEMLLAGLLQPAKPPTFSARVENGRRAMTVAVDEINSISGLLDPGDMIDLLVSLDRKGRKITLPLLLGVQVMATGQRLADDPLTGERRQYATVTLNLTPAQAGALIVGREGGKFTALLRNPQDSQGLPGDAPDLAALLGDADRLAEVPVLYGGSGGRLPAESLRLGAYKAAPGPNGLLSSAAPALAAGNDVPVLRTAGSDAAGGASVHAAAAPTPVLTGATVRGANTR